MTGVTFEPVAVPLRTDEYGAIRVGNTRVLVDLVIHEFQNGATPEGIVESYEALSLPDVYAVLSYYLSNPGPLDEYLRRRDDEAKAVRRKIEAAQPPRPNLRAMLLARLNGKENGNAAPLERP
jgi:uncharacterized protein (DUF433 family)